MQGWQTSYLGPRDMPGEISEFELQAFFSFSRAELDRHLGELNGVLVRRYARRMAGRPHKR
jgi:hypothetical protein